MLILNIHDLLGLTLDGWDLNLQTLFDFDLLIELKPCGRLQRLDLIFELQAVVTLFRLKRRHQFVAHEGPAGLANAVDHKPGCVLIEIDLSNFSLDSSDPLQGSECRLGLLPLLVVAFLTG